MNAKKKPRASWSDVKAKIAHFDQSAMLALIHDLYAANKDNQVFLHARFSLGEDALKPYKATIRRWLCPDVFKNQDFLVSKAKKAVSDYKKAVGVPAGVAELAVYSCECAAEFFVEFGAQDEGSADALVRLFANALALVVKLDLDVAQPMLARLMEVSEDSQQFGYGVGEEMGQLLSAHRHKLDE